MLSNITLTRTIDKCRFGHDTQPLGGRYADLELKAGRQLPAHPAENIVLMQDWIHDCVVGHPQCQLTSEPMLPRRVIKLGLSDTIVLQLEETDGQQGRYAALSHRWGVDVLPTTTQATLLDRKLRIVWTSLSKTLQDAVTLTRLLGLEYLWIDCLCIVQDDISDWQTESSKMASIYENAHITIAANTTSNGFLQGTAARSIKFTRMQLDGNGEEPVSLLLRTPRHHNNFYVTALEGGMEGEEGYPLSQRAWCFQERLLATRVLQFTDSKVIFECKTGQHCECGTINHGLGTPIKHLFSRILQEDFTPVSWVDNVWDGWITILRPYVTKDVTYPTDVLPALAGLASRMQPKFGRYVCGLWANELAEGLFWFVDITEPLTQQDTTGPTFSWTSVVSKFRVKELSWPHMYRGQGNPIQKLFTILDFDCVIDGLNEYGRVASASMKIQGPVMQIRLIGISAVPGYNAILRSETREQLIRFWIDGSSLATLNVEAELFCLLGFTWTRRYTKPEHLISALVLRPSKQPGVYERVGCIPHLDNSVSWLEATSRMELTII